LTDIQNETPGAGERGPGGPDVDAVRVGRHQRRPARSSAAHARCPPRTIPCVGMLHMLVQVWCIYGAWACMVRGHASHAANHIRRTGRTCQVRGRPSRGAGGIDYGVRGHANHAAADRLLRGDYGVRGHAPCAPIRACPLRCPCPIRSTRRRLALRGLERLGCGRAALRGLRGLEPT
jgi:hypothetical protein